MWYRRGLARAGVLTMVGVLVGVLACTTSDATLPEETSQPAATPSAPVVGTSEPSAPLLTASPTLVAVPAATPSPTATLGPLPTEPEGLAPSRDPAIAVWPTRTESPATPAPTEAAGGATNPAATKTPAPAKTPAPSLGEWTGKAGKPATRVVIRGLRIDLPVVVGDERYPKCDVAQYLTNFVNPGMEGSTYIYAHAQRGMFLPLLQASKRNNGAEMIGMQVDVYTSDRARWVYRIFKVKRHATDFSLARNLKNNEHRLVLQTSEGPSGKYPKLQVAARPVAVYKATAAEARPAARPRVCGR